MWGDRGIERLGTPSWHHAEVTNSERERTYQSTISSVIENTKKMSLTSRAVEYVLDILRLVL